MAMVLGCRHLAYIRFGVGWSSEVYVDSGLVTKLAMQTDCVTDIGAWLIVVFRPHRCIQWLPMILARECDFQYVAKTSVPIGLKLEQEAAKSMKNP